MKRVLLMAMAVCFVVTAAHAQVVIDVEAFKKREARSDADIQNPKKNTKVATWMERGKLFLDAANEPVKGLHLGQDETPVKLILGQTKSQSETINGVKYARYKSNYVTAYLRDKKLEIWVPTKEVIEGARDKAFEAYSKAYELDPASKAKEGIQQLVDGSKQDAENFFRLRKYVEAADNFKRAYEMQLHPAIGVTDTVTAFNAGFMYTLAEKPAEGAKYLEIALKHGYESDGDIYYLLYFDYSSLKETAKAAQVLMEGYKKYPNNQTVLEYTINHYVMTGADPSSMMATMDQAVRKANNPTLWQALGRLYDKHNNLEKAIEAFSKAAELQPKDYNAQFNLGLLYVKEANILNDAMNAKQHTSTAAYKEELAVVFAAYEKAVAPLEKAHEIDPKNIVTLDLLKNVTFRLRDSVEGMMDKYNKYDELLKKAQAK